LLATGTASYRGEGAAPTAQGPFREPENFPTTDVRSQWRSIRDGTAPLRPAIADLGDLQKMTAHLPHWAAYQDALAQLAIGVEHYRGW